MDTELYFQLEFEEEGIDVDMDFEEIYSHTTDSHRELIHRDLPDQHPIKSITGLESVLEDLSSNMDKTYIHKQRTASSTWDVVHNLNKYPSVMIVDSANTVVIGEISYVDMNHLIITFIGSFSGRAYLN